MRHDESRLVVGSLKLAIHCREPNSHDQIPYLHPACQRGPNYPSSLNVMSPTATHDRVRTLITRVHYFQQRAGILPTYDRSRSGPVNLTFSSGYALRRSS
ncbi:hypothetical protein LIA77_02393 [Sarocladium implicatum]|nr:hypothetical protein LIA77_02393 [Sarocladium implicatum]